MTGVDRPIVEIDGRAAATEDIWQLDLSHGGHFTAMQVRDRRTLGLDLHLARLDAANRELFGAGLDVELVRHHIRHAISGGVADASVRVNVFRPPDAQDVSIVISVRPPAPVPRDAQKLQTVAYQRPAAHLKHANGFGQGYFGGLAHANGFDEALFVTPDGAIAEGSITNIGFLDGNTIVWPDASALLGVMMQVLQRELTRANVPWQHTTVHVADLPSFDGAFVTNSHGLASVARIDDYTLPTEATLLRTVAALLADAPSDPI